MFTVCGKEYTVRPVRFKLYIDLSYVQQQVIEFSTPIISGLLAENIILFISQASDCPIEVLQTAPWKEVAQAYVDCATEHLISVNIPLCRRASSTEKREPWDYEKREWFAYAHLIAKEYGWNLEYIADLDVQTAMRLIQEILAERQIAHEWEWDLSERCTLYDPDTKTSRYQALPRPSWMQEVVAPPKKYKFPKRLMPVGIVMKPDGTAHADL